MRLFIVIFFGLILITCQTKTYKLSEKDYEWVPYNGRDTLIFTSSLGENDTLFVRNGRTSVDYKVDPLSLRAPDSIEFFDIPYRYNFFDTIQQINNFRVTSLIYLKRTTDRKTNVGFSPLPEDKTLCEQIYFDIESLNKKNLITFKTPFHTYNDVLVFEPNSNGSCATKIYWSKSLGLVGYINSSKIQYTLAK